MHENQLGYLMTPQLTCVFTVKSTTTVQPKGENIDVQLFSTTQRTIYSTIEKAGLALCIVLVILVLTFFAGLAYWLRFHKPTPEDTLELSHSGKFILKMKILIIVCIYWSLGEHANCIVFFIVSMLGQQLLCFH